VCAQRGGRCNMQWVGACREIDGDTGAASPRQACEDIGPDGGFLRCHNRASNAGTDTYPEPNKTYERVLTIHLPRSTFQGGIAAPCGAPPEVEPEPPIASGLAGDRCGNDDGCTT